mmetsp:Transcript_58717/g.139918  ORF Transcript_58717/g.139918 Transcript_58717/m.139918 type:complete len:116 (-) Transcript_58717:612-959(-)
MITSFTVQACLARTSLMRVIGTGVILVNVCLPLYGKNGCRCSRGALILMLLSTGTTRREKIPRQHAATRRGPLQRNEQNLARHPGLDCTSCVGLEEEEDDVDALLFPRRAAGNGM